MCKIVLFFINKHAKYLQHLQSRKIIHYNLTRFDLEFKSIFFLQIKHQKMDNLFFEVLVIQMLLYFKVGTLED